MGTLSHENRSHGDCTDGSTCRLLVWVGLGYAYQLTIGGGHGLCGLRCYRQDSESLNSYYCGDAMGSR